MTEERKAPWEPRSFTELKAGLTVLSIKESAFHPGKTRQRANLIPKPWKRGGLEDFSRTKEDEMTAATFDHQVRKSLEFFEQQRNEETARAHFIGALYFEARAESRMCLEANSDTD